MKSVVVAVVAAFVALLARRADAQPHDSAPASAKASASAHDNQLRLELGVGGPSGVMALRYSRVLPTKTRIEPAVGLAYTGVIGSLLVTQPLFEGSTTTRGGTRVPSTFEVYLGYSVSYLGDSLRHPWVGREAFIPNGTYQWIDGGVSTQTRWGRMLLTGGVSITKLVSGPPDIGGMNIDEETFWWLFPEGWFGKQRMAPSLWSSIGLAF